jgi:hypothetical protein
VYNNIFSAYRRMLSTEKMKKVKKMKKMVKSMMMIEKLTNVKTKRSVTRTQG